MADFEKAYEKTMGHEGWYVNDPDDAGGETYKGISRVYNPSWSGWAIIDIAKGEPNFPDSLESNMELQESVGLFYKDKYWDVNRLDEDTFAQSVGEEMFDTGVNMGVSRAGKFLQKSLNYLNRNGDLYDELVVDGKIGPASLDALAKCANDETVLMSMLNTLQGQHYMNYMDDSPSQKKYARGWFKRVKYCAC